jgi:hypothetical protein
MYCPSQSVIKIIIPKHAKKFLALFSSIDFFPSKTLDTTKQNLKANSGYTKFSKGRQEVRSLLEFISLYKVKISLFVTIMAHLFNIK